MIEINRLKKIYKDQTVLANVSVKFRDGLIYGLVGPNGCGKTTLMRCICGFALPTSGYVAVNGKIVGRDIDFAPSTGMIIETPGFLGYLTGKQNLQMLASISGQADQSRITEILHLVGLHSEDKKPVSKYSLGMRQRLGIAQAIMENPEHLILDEPFNGLDQAGIQDIHHLLQELKREGKVIILASHSAVDISTACDIVYQFRSGNLYEVDVGSSANCVQAG